MEQAAAVLERAGELLWGRGTVGLVLAVGLYFLVGSRFFPFRRWGLIWRQTIGSIFRPKEGEGVSPFRAMAAALGGTMGVGNIMGVAAAIALGGPGAVFWIWVGALAGMMTKFAEVTLAVTYRKKEKDGWTGGPMYYIRCGLGQKKAAALAAILCVAGSFGVGSLSQSNALAAAVEQSLPLPRWAIGAAAAAVTLAVAAGGAKRLLHITAALVPIMSLCYFAGAGVVLAANIRYVLPALGLVFRDAFAPLACGGTVVGFFSCRCAAVGTSKGIFTHEAGLGSAPIAHACAQTDLPGRQGLWGIMEVFLDTVVMCTVTALVILTTGTYRLSIDSQQMTTAAFTAVLGRGGKYFLSTAVLLFALAAIFAWGMYGQQALAYLCQGRKGKRAQRGYSLLLAFSVLLGCILPARMAWAVADLLNGCMLLPNLAALVLLSPTVFAQLRRLEQLEPPQGKRSKKDRGRVSL